MVHLLLLRRPTASRGPSTEERRWYHAFPLHAPVAVLTTMPLCYIYVHDARQGLGAFWSCLGPCCRATAWRLHPDCFPPRPFGGSFGPLSNGPTPRPGPASAWDHSHERHRISRHIKQLLLFLYMKCFDTHCYTYYSTWFTILDTHCMHESKMCTLHCIASEDNQPAPHPTHPTHRQAHTWHAPE